MYYNSLLDWRQKTSRMKGELCDKILTSSSLPDDAWGEVFALYVTCCFSGLQGAAKELLEAYFDAQPTSEPHPRSSEKRILELISQYSESAMPRNVPWHVAQIDEGTQQPQQPGIDNPSFFQLGWTETHWIPETDYAQGENWQRIDDKYDPHQWRDCEDPWTHAICARLLCTVPEGQVPDPAAIEEAFEAVDRLFTQLPRRKTGLSGAGWPHGHIFPMKVYFDLAYGLGRREKAMEIFKLACTVEEWCPDNLILLPALYEVYFRDDAASNPGSGYVRPQLIAEPDGTAAVNSIVAALIHRKQNGRQEPLHGMPWAELLRRFSEAAFKLHEEEYAGIDEPPQSPSDILLPPITPEKLAEVEQALGPLPPDLREMVQIANGFKGGWHFAGGGFPGVDQLEATPSGDYETYFGIERDPEVSTRTETNPDGTTRTVTTHAYNIGVGPEEGMDAGPVWIGFGTVENDDFEHVVCPPETWRKLSAGQGKTQADGGAGGAKEGDYRVTYMAHWDGGGDDAYRSMRHWISSMTIEMERELELNGGNKEDGSDDGENEEQDEGGDEGGDEE